MALEPQMILGLAGMSCGIGSLRVSGMMCARGPNEHSFADAGYKKDVTNESSLGSEILTERHMVGHSYVVPVLRSLTH